MAEIINKKMHILNMCFLYISHILIFTIDKIVNKWYNYIK